MHSMRPDEPDTVSRPVPRVRRRKGCVYAQAERGPPRSPRPALVDVQRTRPAGHVSSQARSVVTLSSKARDVSSVRCSDAAISVTG